MKNKFLRYSAINTLVMLFFSTSSVQAAWWMPILTCDNGAATVDIDLGERRNTQLVIRNSQIISHFNSARVDLTGTSWFVWDGHLHNLTNNGNETVVPGEMNQGVFQPNQFRGFTSPVSYGGRQFRVYRVGSGLKIEAFVPGHGRSCDGDWNSGGGCNNPIEVESEKKLADWYFQNCQELQIL